MSGRAISFRPRWGQLLALAVLGGVLGVFVLLGLIYWPHEPRRFELDEAKGFGFFDPHLELAVVAVDRGDSARGAASRSIVFRVTVEVRNTAVGPDFVVDPTPLAFSVRDAGGRVFPPTPTPEYPDERLTELLGNTDTYRRTLRFEIPSDANQPELWVLAESGLERWLPAVSRSLLTPKLVFPLVSSAEP